jgi:hypothetical protein
VNTVTLADAKDINATNRHIHFRTSDEHASVAGTAGWRTGTLRTRPPTPGGAFSTWPKSRI